MSLLKLIVYIQKYMIVYKRELIGKRLIDDCPSLHYELNASR